MPTLQLTGIRVVVFDLDDTLYAERDFAYSGFEAVARWLARRTECPFDPARRMRELFETDDRARVFNRLCIELGRSEPDPWVDKMVACYRGHAPGIALFPDAEAALHRWSGCYWLGLISDGPEAVQQRKVDALGLAARLDQIVLTDRWGRSFWKPHPRAYERVEQISGERGSACVYIADNPAKDFVAPNRLGWRSVRVRRPGGVYAQAETVPGGEPEHSVASLREIDLTA